MSKPFTIRNGHPKQWRVSLTPRSGIVILKATKPVEYMEREQNTPLGEVTAVTYEEAKKLAFDGYKDFYITLHTGIYMPKREELLERGVSDFRAFTRKALECASDCGAENKFDFLRWLSAQNEDTLAYNIAAAMYGDEVEFVELKPLGAGLTATEEAATEEAPVEVPELKEAA